jgi:hypothetical protein
VRKSRLEIKKFALYFFFRTVFHFLALYFEKIALLLANQNWEFFSMQKLLYFPTILTLTFVGWIYKSW